MKTLRNAAVGSTVKVVRLHGEGAVKRRIMDMGITRGAGATTPRPRRVPSCKRDGDQTDRRPAFSFSAAARLIKTQYANVPS